MNQARMICSVCGNTRVGEAGDPCGRPLVVSGVGAKLCEGSMIELKEGYIPGLTRPGFERGKYDAQTHK
jgi:hypothetical protein